MKIQYVPRNFAPKSEKIIETANTIIAEYDIELTLRQLFYQFVARGLIPNTQKDYKNLGSILNDARLAGLVSWEAIVDRTRNLMGNSHWASPASAVSSLIDQYAEDKWADQEFYVEVWIEKDALVGIVERVCVRNDVNFFSCRGYTSQSELHSAALRLRRRERDGFKTVVIHLGDHDPSGLDMTRDIRARLALFESDADVERIALNMDQVRKYNPPPNPAKLSDSRAKAYIRKIGRRESWELDALDPKTLDALIESKILTYRDESKWKKSVKAEEEGRRALRKAARSLDED